MSTSPTPAPLECLQALVGLRGACESPDPVAGYLDDLALGQRELSAYLTAADPTPRALFERCRSLALRELVLRCEEHLRPTYRPGTLMGETRLGYPRPELEYAAAGAAGLLDGVRVTLDAADRFLRLDLVTVALQLETDGDVDVVVWDLDEAAEVHRVTVPAQAGQLVTVPLHLGVTSHRRRRDLFVGRAADGPRGVVADLDGKRRTTCCGGRSGLRLDSVEASAATLATATPTAAGVTRTSTTRGLSLVVGLLCDHAGFLCTLSRSLILPALYRTAAEVYAHALRAVPPERLNPSVVDPERLGTLRDEYLQLTERALAPVLRGLQPPPDDRCYACQRRTRTLVALP